MTAVTLSHFVPKKLVFTDVLLLAISSSNCASKLEKAFPTEISYYYTPARCTGILPGEKTSNSISVLHITATHIMMQYPYYNAITTLAKHSGGLIPTHHYCTF